MALKSSSGSSTTDAVGQFIRPTVLLLEDDSTTYRAMQQLMGHYECDVFVARTILEAMPILPRIPQFAVIDLMLPDGGGERILDIIRKRKLSTKVAIVTGCEDRDRLQEAARLKPDLILKKPVDFFRLLQFLRSGSEAIQAANPA